MGVMAVSAQVFISHSSKDQPSAEAVLRALEAQHIRCWYAPRDLPAGSNYMGTINRAIQTSELFLIVLSGSANQSIEMKKETSLANRGQLPIIPFRIDETTLDDDWAYEISVRQYVDASKSIPRALPILVSQVRSVLATRRYTKSRPPTEPRYEEAPRAPPAASAMSKRSRSLLSLGIGGLAGLAIAIVATVVMIDDGRLWAGPTIANSSPTHFTAPAKLPTVNAEMVRPSTLSMVPPPRLPAAGSATPGRATQGAGRDPQADPDSSYSSRINMDEEGPSEWRRKP